MKKWIVLTLLVLVIGSMSMTMSAKTTADQIPPGDIAYQLTV